MTSVRQIHPLIAAYLTPEIRQQILDRASDDELRKFNKTAEEIDKAMTACLKLMAGYKQEKQ